MMRMAGDRALERVLAGAAGAVGEDELTEGPLAFGV
jgi:hypothetical protein